jgi:hypothetical protein
LADHPFAVACRFEGAGARQVRPRAGRAARARGGRARSVMAGTGPRVQGRGCSSGGDGSPGEQRPPARFAGVERTDLRGEQSSEAGAAFAGTPTLGSSEGKARVSARAGGSGAVLRDGVWPGAGGSTDVADCKGVSGLERGTRSSQGESSEGGLRSSSAWAPRSGSVGQRAACSGPGGAACSVGRGRNLRGVGLGSAKRPGGGEGL